MGTNELRLIDARTFRQIAGDRDARDAARDLPEPGRQASLHLRPWRRQGQSSSTRDEQDRRHLDHPRWRQPRHGRGLGRRQDAVAVRPQRRRGLRVRHADRPAGGQDPGGRQPARPRRVAAARSLLPRATPGTCDEARPGGPGGRAPARRVCLLHVVRVREPGPTGDDRRRRRPAALEDGSCHAVRPPRRRARRPRLAAARGRRSTGRRAGRPHLRGPGRRPGGGRPVDRRGAADRPRDRADRAAPVARGAGPRRRPAVCSAGPLQSSAEATPPSRTSCRRWPAPPGT